MDAPSGPVRRACRLSWRASHRCEPGDGTPQRSAGVGASHPRCLLSACVSYPPALLPPPVRVCLALGSGSVVAASSPLVEPFDDVRVRLTGTSRRSLSSGQARRTGAWPWPPPGRRRFPSPPRAVAWPPWPPPLPKSTVSAEPLLTFLLREALRSAVPPSTSGAADGALACGSGWAFLICSSSSRICGKPCPSSWVSALISASSCSWRLVNIQSFPKEDPGTESEKPGTDDRRDRTSQVTG